VGGEKGGRKVKKGNIMMNKADRKEKENKVVIEQKDEEKEQK
jgi:hypothetical protein